MNPLARIPSLKLKLGLVIVLAILVTLATMLVARKLGLRLRWGALVALVVSLASVQLVARGMTAPLRAMAARGRGDGARRARSARDCGRARRGRAAGGGVQHDGGRARDSSTARAAISSPTPRTSCARRSARCGRRWRTPSTASSRPTCRRCSTQVERLGRLADQLLDLSALEAGARGLDSAHRSRLAELLTAATGAAVEMPDGLRIDGDLDRLRQVVANLVDNARRHAPGSTVVAPCRVPGPVGGVRLEIEDDGRGPGARRGRRASSTASPAATALALDRGLRPRARDRPLDRRAPRRRDPRRSPSNHTACRMVIDLP